MTLVSRFLEILIKQMVFYINLRKFVLMMMENALI